MCGGVERELTLWEWQALTWGWNDRHATPEDKAKALPDPDLVRRSLKAAKERATPKA